MNFMMKISKNIKSIEKTIIKNNDKDLFFFFSIRPITLLLMKYLIKTNNFVNRLLKLCSENFKFFKFR